VLDEQLGYWRERLGGELPVLRLPVDHERAPGGGSRLRGYDFKLEEELSGKLRKLSEGREVTLFMMLLAGFKALLYRLSGQSDLIVGTPIAGRSQIETEGLIGFFLNTLALRTDLSGNPTFSELLSRVREVALGAQAHQDAPYEKLIEVLQPERSLSRTPLFQVWFVLQNAPMGALQLPGLKISTFEPRTGTAQFDLVLSMSETGRQISGSLEYNADLFDAETISDLVRHLKSLFRAVTADPGTRLLEIALDDDTAEGSVGYDAPQLEDAASQFIF
jgi:aspartate racemase